MLYKPIDKNCPIVIHSKAPNVQAMNLTYEKPSK
jgi:hypothetical protein